MATRINSNYAASNKDDLFAEIEARKKEGSPNFDSITSATLKDDLVAALILDDEHKAVRSDKVTAVAAADGEDVSGLPDVPDETPNGELVEVQPLASEYKGTYRKKSDNLVYALAVVEDFIRGKNYHARNKKFFWEGTKSEFEDQFVKE